MTEKSNYSYAEDIKKIVEKFIETDFPYIDIDKIVVVRTKKHIKQGDVLGQCNAFPDKVRFLTNKFYMLEFPPVFDTLSEAQKQIVVKHECKHIPEDMDGLVPHDIQDFRSIINEYGVDWIHTVAKAEEEIERLKEKEKLEKKLSKLKKDIKKEIDEDKKVECEQDDKN